MAYDLEEQESLSEIKAWWEKWGTLILTIVTVACLAAAGMRGWQWYQMKQSADAGSLYSLIKASGRLRWDSICRYGRFIGGLYCRTTQ